jgi:phosphopantetheinyl transferase
MRLYCADIRGADETKALTLGRKTRRGSAFGASLLLYAVRDCWGDGVLTPIAETENGRPYFIEWPNRHFSISHTQSHVLVAVSDFRVGADIETRRERPAKLIEKLTTEREREDFDFFELWVLRESLFKLTGEGSLRTMRFSRENDIIVPPVFGAQCRGYDCVPGCAAAVCCFEGNFPESVIFVPVSEICT